MYCVTEFLIFHVVDFPGYWRSLLFLKDTGTNLTHK